MDIQRGIKGVLAAVAALAMGTSLLTPAGAASQPESCMMRSTASSATSSTAPSSTSAAAGRCCVSQPLYSLAGRGTRMGFSGVPTFKNGPGGKMIVSRSYSGNVAAEVVAGAESEVGAVLARARAHVSASLATSNSTSSTNTYERRISRDKYGNARYVSWGQDVSYTKVRVNADCSRTTLAKGRIKYPSTVEGWYYWETDS
jgi:hypothetical protein